MLLALIAWGLWLGNALALVVAPPAFVLYLNRRQIGPEERALESAFGEEYVRYRRAVRRWL
jgi:protein-S-isoprenylcysteine O-methyltransferase Ste14